MSTGVIKKVAGPLVIAEGMRDANMFDVVRVSNQRLIGEIIEMHGDEASIQVYEETSGLGPGEPVESMEVPMSVELGPGLITSIYDGIQRPLEEIRTLSGDFIGKGIEVPAVSHDKLWHFVPSAEVGSKISRGSVFGTVQETERVEHRIMVPPAFKGELTITSIAAEGDYKVTDTIAQIEDESGKSYPLTMIQHWPIRVPRPVADHLDLKVPLITGLRVIDTLFPLSKGGTVAIPGGFGTGKTMTQHSIAQWCDADIIVYIGCGERGNEMTDVLREFPNLIDPRTGLSLMQRTVLIANTSNMPVSAREASIYTP